MIIARYFIVGGTLRVHKSVFVKEMLCQDSRIKALLNWKSSEGFTYRHPEVSQSESDNVVTINFSNSDNIDIGETPDEILGYLKKRYKDKIGGNIALRSNISYFEIDLNSTDEEIRYVLE